MISGPTIAELAQARRLASTILVAPYPSTVRPCRYPAHIPHGTRKLAFYILGLGNNPFLDTGGGMSNLQRSVNLVDSVSLQKSSHALKFGADYRRLTPVVAPPAYTQDAFFFGGLAAAQSGQLGETTGDGVDLESASRVPLILQNFSLFAQDTWRVRPRLTVTYGLRWDVDFTPKTSSGPSLPAVVNFNDLSTLALAPPGTPVFNTRYGNLAPRVGVAYQISQKAGWESVLRGGWGIFYDLATTQLHVSNCFLSFWQQQLPQSYLRWSIPIDCFFCCATCDKCREPGYRGCGS